MSMHACMRMDMDMHFGLELFLPVDFPPAHFPPDLPT